MLANDQKINFSRLIDHDHSWAFINIDLLQIEPSSTFSSYQRYKIQYFSFFTQENEPTAESAQKKGYYNRIRIFEWAKRKFSKSLKVNLKFLASRTCRSKKKSNRQKRNLGLIKLLFWASGTVQDFLFFGGRDPWIKTDQNRAVQKKVKKSLSGPGPENHEKSRTYSD